MLESGLDGIRMITDFELKDRKVFIRLDLNVPMENGKITDDTRIRAALPTIRHAMKEEAKIVLASHLGRPKGADRAQFSLGPVGERLAELLDVEVLLVEDPESDAPKGMLSGLKSNQIILLENIRYSEGEEANSHDLASTLAAYTEVYINDAFGASHRAHASIVALPTIVKEKGIGFLMQKEIDMLDRLLHKTQKPFIAILGGAKVSDKIGVIENLMDRVDTFIIGGAMAYTFLAAQNVNVGNSRVEKDKVKLAQELLGRIEARNKKIFLPVDHVVAQKFDDSSSAKSTSDSAIEAGWMALDIGPRTRELFQAEIQKGKTIFWNGPMGVFERPPFEKGTFFIAETLAKMSSATTIVGGGDSAAAVKMSGLDEKMTHISTGGGASLEYLQGDRLPGLEVLRSRKKPTT